MPEFNLSRIHTLTGEINTALAKLEKVKALSKEEFLANPEKIDSAKYNLVVATEGAIDLCSHITAKSGGRSPESYADCFSLMGELGLFDDEVTQKLRQMAKFRNLLVHLYWKVDNSRVYDIIQDDIFILRHYLKIIGEHVSG